MYLKKNIWSIANGNATSAFTSANYVNCFLTVFCFVFVFSIRSYMMKIHKHKTYCSAEVLKLQTIHRCWSSCPNRWKWEQTESRRHAFFFQPEVERFHDFDFRKVVFCNTPIGVNMITPLWAHCLSTNMHILISHSTYLNESLDKLSNSLYKMSTMHEIYRLHDISSHNQIGP